MPVRRLSREGGGWLEDQDGHPVLHTSGTPYEEGYQHGRLLRANVRECFHEVWEEGFFVAHPLFPRWLWYAYARFNAPHFSADETDELRGLAEGAGLDYADVLVMNSQSPVDVLHNWLSPSSYGGCTQFIARGAATFDGRMLAGRNLDTINLGRLHRYGVVQVHHPEKGFAYLTPGFAGKVLDAITGWNDAGLQVCQDDAEARWVSPYGLYSGALIRRLTQFCSTPEEAEEKIREVSHLAVAGKNITAANGFDARLVEFRQSALQALLRRKTVEGRGVGRPVDPPDTLMVTNHYTSPVLSAVSPPPSASSRQRLERLRELMATAYGKLDALRAMDILTDKLNVETHSEADSASPSDNIINWYGPRLRSFGPFPVNPRIEVRIATTCSTVSDFHERVMWVALGNKPYIDDPTDYFPVNVDAELRKLP